MEEGGTEGERERREETNDLLSSVTPSLLHILTKPAGDNAHFKASTQFHNSEAEDQFSKLGHLIYNYSIRK